MPSYEFDGSKLKYGSKTVANVRNDRIYEGSGSAKCLANFRDERVYAGSGSAKCLINIRGDKVYEGSGSSKRIGSLDDARDAIDGPGGITLAALWFVCVR